MRSCFKELGKCFEKGSSSDKGKKFDLYKDKAKKEDEKLKDSTSNIPKSSSDHAGTQETNALEGGPEKVKKLLAEDEEKLYKMEKQDHLLTELRPTYEGKLEGGFAKHQDYQEVKDQFIKEYHDLQEKQEIKEDNPSYDRSNERLKNYIALLAKRDTRMAYIRTCERLGISITSTEDSTRNKPSQRDLSKQSEIGEA